MTKPVSVNVEHALGQEEAVRRVRSGIEQYRGTIENFVRVHEEHWEDHCLSFRIGFMNQICNGTLRIENDHARLEILLPGMLGYVATKMLGKVKKQGQLLLGH